MYMYNVFSYLCTYLPYLSKIIYKGMHSDSLEAFYSKKSFLQLFFPIDSHPQFFSDLPQTSCDSLANAQMSLG